MIFYEIPYEKGSTQMWYVDGLAEGRKNFDTRVAALGYAMKLAGAAVRSRGDKACVAIQGADGSWRSFDPDMLPIN
jgi:hypothetical protein